MADFKIIETQEQFDEAIKARLERDRESYARKFEGWISPEEFEKRTGEQSKKIKALEAAAAEVQKQLAAKDEEIAKGEKYRTDLEKTRIALEAGLKIDYAERLMGVNAEEWKVDAAKLAKDFAAAKGTAPLGSNEPTNTGKRSTRNQFADWMQEKMNA